MHNKQLLKQQAAGQLRAAGSTATMPDRDREGASDEDSVESEALSPRTDCSSDTTAEDDEYEGHRMVTADDCHGACSRGAARSCVGAAGEHCAAPRVGLGGRLASCLGRCRPGSMGYGSLSDEEDGERGGDSDEGKRPLRILSIDGGGIKGVVPALIMEEIERLCAPYRIFELFDLVCGTSTGGILALGTCVARAPVKEMTNVYEKQAKLIWTKRGGAKGLAAGIMGAQVGALILDTKYDASNLEALLKEKSSRSAPPGRRAVGSMAASSGANGGHVGRRMLRMDDNEHAYPRVFVVSAQEKPGSVAEAPFQQFLLRSYRPESECFPPSDMSCVYLSRHTPLCT